MVLPDAEPGTVFTNIAAGFFNSLALRADGTVIAWGLNNFGQTNVPAGLSNVVGIAAGWHHSLAFMSDGTVVGWGAGMFLADPPDSFNYGQATAPAGLSNVVAIAAGQQACSFAIMVKKVPVRIETAGQSPEICFHSFSRQHYSVEYSPDLSPGSWSDLPGGTVSGTGHDVFVTDTNAAATAPARFYRVKQF